MNKRTKGGALQRAHVWRFHPGIGEEERILYRH